MPSGKRTALKARNLTVPGRYGDGAGLWLQVRGVKGRSWLFRYVMAGTQRQMGLGPFPDVSLADARESARKCRALIRDGQDPIEQRRQARASGGIAVGAVTFRQVAEQYLASHEAAWRNAKHRYQWRATLDLACAAFGIGRLPLSPPTT